MDKENKDMARPEGPGSHEPRPLGLGPSGFDPSRGIWDRLQDVEFRHAFTAETIASQLGTQLRMLRVSRGVTVDELAAAIDCSPLDIRVVESAASLDIEIDLLLQIAAYFDVALSARFVPFSEMLIESGYIPTIHESTPRDIMGGETDNGSVP